MAAALKTVTREEALSMHATPTTKPSAAPRATVRFIRTMSPDQPLELGDGKSIHFHIPVNNVTGQCASYGTYLTDIPEEIEAIRKIKKEMPHLYVYER